MSDFPFGKYVKLLYIPNLPEGIPEYGGMYASMPDDVGEPVQLGPLRPRGDQDKQKWMFLTRDTGNGVNILGYIRADDGVLPPDVGPAWTNNEPDPDSPITTAMLAQASSYDMNIQRPYENGWIISIQPTDPYTKLGVTRYIGAPNQTNVVGIAGVPVVPNESFPGWFATRD
ncbi:peptidase inhibitor clitocypin domain-containing protein [Ceratobasidium sp. AG-Ba]|nr:peptidase inhibitor clitocypin domain-containing protein [Ceratobasidium sp. AG-Ba]